MARQGATLLALALLVTVARGIRVVAVAEGDGAGFGNKYLDDLDDEDDVFMNTKLEKTCSQDIEKFCHDIPQGDDRVRRCLQEHKYDADMTPECKDAVVDDAEDRAHQGALINLALCATDMVEHTPECASHNNGNKKIMMIRCLIDNKKKITDPLCKSEIFHAEKEQAADFRLDPDLAEVCHHDQQVICGNVRPGKGRVHRCLRKHFTQLQDPCLYAEFEEAVREAGDVRLKPSIYIACKGDMAKFCPDAHKGDGGMIVCLRDNKGDDGMSAMCKKVVTEDEIQSSRDIELNPRLFNFCRKDIDIFCPDMFEIPGGLRDGAVTECLVDSRNQLQSTFCKGEIVRHMRKVANDVRMAPEIEEACAADIGLWCNDIEPGEGRVHQCLKKFFDSLTESCKKAEFNEQVLESERFGLKPFIYRQCLQEVETLCDGVEPGEGRMLECLQDKRNEEGMGSMCRQMVLRDMIFAAKDFRLNAQLYKYCMKDVGELCYAVEHSELDGGRVIEHGAVTECLVEKRDEITRDECQAQVDREIEVQAEDVKLDPEVSEACQFDIDSYCSDVPEGKGRVHACLRKHINNDKEPLSQKCQDAEFEEEVREEEGVAFKVGMSANCKKEMKTLCKDTKPGGGRMIACLRKNRESEKMTPACRSSVFKDAKKASTEIEFNPRLVKECKKPIKKFCGTLMSSFRRGKRGGMVIACLIKNQKSITLPACREQLMLKEEEEAEDIRLDPDVDAACASDISLYCADTEPGEGRVHQCLRKHYNELTWGCRMKEFEEEQREHSDVRLNLKLRKTCMRDMMMFCKRVPKGGSHVMNCLHDHIDEPDMSPECKEGLEDDYQQSGKNIMLKPDSFVACIDDLKKTCHDELEASEDAAMDGHTIQCLVENYFQITSTDCASLTFRQIQRQAADIRNSMKMSEACSDDMMRFCSDVLPGGGRMHACLRGHLEELETDCREIEFRQEVVEEADVRLNPEIVTACTKEFRTLCQGTAFGDHMMYNCLEENIEDMGMSSTCREAVSSNEQASAKDLRLRPETFARCKSDMMRQCKVDIDSDEFDDAPMEGLASNCLVEHYGKIDSAECKKDIEFMVLQQVKVPASIPGFSAACKADVDRACKDVRMTKVVDCVSEKKSQLSTACQKFVPELARRKKIATAVGEARFRDSTAPKSWDRTQAKMAAQKQSGLILSGGIALAAIAALVLVIAGAVYWTFLKFTRDTTKGYTVVIPKKG